MLAAIKAAFTRYAVLIFPDQGFSDESHLDFARHFGPLETSVFKLRADHKMRLDEKMADVGNLDADNNILKGQLLVIKVYCPEYIEEFQEFADDLKTADVAKG